MSQIIQEAEAMNNAKTVPNGWSVVSDVSEWSLVQWTSSNYTLILSIRLIFQHRPKQKSNFIKSLQIMPSIASNNPLMIFHFALNNAGIIVLNNDTKS